MAVLADSIDGNGIYAIRAEADKDGNRIDQTYAKLTDIPSGAQLVPTATSADADKVLTVDAQGTPGWANPAPGGVTDVEVDGVSVVSQGIASITMPTVDQTYNASSANAQSGVAVAQAIASAPAASYTAGDGISIEQGEISVAYDTDTLQINSPSSNIYSKNAFTGESGNMYGTIEDGALAAAISTTANSFTLHIPGNTFSTSENMTGREILLVLSSDPYFNTLGWNVFVPLSFTTQGGTTWIDEQNVTMSGFGAPGWVGDVPFYTYAFRFEIASDGDLIGTTVEPTSPTFSSPVLFTYGSEGGLAVKNPLPASDVIDENKVLTVNSNGTPVWAVPASATVDQVYNSSSTNAQSGTAVAGAISGINQVPPSTSSDADKVLKVNSSGTPEWSTGGGSQVQSDWTEADNSDPSYIQNKPVPKTLTAGTGISITENASTITIAATGGSSGVTDVEVDGTSVVSGGVASITMPTVDQTYDSSSTNAQSGVAVAEALVSLGTDRTVIMNTPQASSTSQMTLTEPFSNFEYIEIYATWDYNTVQRIQAFARFPGNQTVFNVSGFGCGNLSLSSYGFFLVTLDCSVSGTTITVNRALRALADGTVTSNTDALIVQKIVGCHRIASN